MKRFIKEYSIELISAGLLIIGIFLMVERFEIRGTILTGLTNVFNAILSFLKKILTGASSRAVELSLSDALGSLLILLAVGFIVWRIRYRFQNGRRWASDFCPKCSGPIQRVHRSARDRVLGAAFFPDARRYRCVDPKCGWSGLLRRHIHHSHRHRERVSRPENS
jgi:hypothetical protein